MTQHLMTRKYLREIPRKADFEALLEESTLSDTEKEIMRLHYLQQKNFAYIGDTLGFSEETIEERHKRALKKLTQLIYTET